MTRNQLRMTHRLQSFMAAGLLVAGCLTPPAESPGTTAGAAAPKPMETMKNAPEGWNNSPKDGSEGVKTPEISGHNLLANATFDDGKSIPWTTSFTVPGAGRGFVMDKEFCVEVTNAGVNNWDAQFRHREMVIQKGHTYSVKYKIHSTKPTKARIKVGMSGPPYAEYWVDEVDLKPEPQIFRGVFQMENDDDPTAEIAFHIGGEVAEKTPVPFSVCVDDVWLDDPQFGGRKSEETMPLANVLVNQVGYLPSLPKIANARDASASPVDWQLLDASGKAVATGKTTVFGKDAASGDNVHIIDFSSFKTPGQYKLQVGKEQSHTFAIAPDAYRKLKYDALAYFYHNRSGIEIKMPYAGDPKLARPAGHAPDKAACAPKSGCDYTLDVTGGWYDAGDHGKYVVNGGISAWTMLNQYERALFLGKSAGDFGDGTMNIPENKNGVADILDEARWEVEFLLKMQVPDGQPLAGMVHHKMHDKAWTALGLSPDKDPMTRYLYPPSTAATLNTAAAAAQAARIWQKIDPAFSKQCLEAAKKAYAAAQKNPKLLAKAGGEGGGPYDDGDVSDEFYWAAAELYITTGDDGFKKDMTSSKWWKQLPTKDGPSPTSAMTSMTWQATAGLGSLSLAVVPNKLANADLNEIRANVKKAADEYVKAMDGEGYRVPFKAARYPWGSNSFVLSNLMVIALAGDFTKDAKYSNAVATGMDYILGRNPLDQSYVTGYGTRPLKNPHHRFWAHQANGAFPSAPAGAVSGGPNSGVEDPYAKSAGLPGCAPEKCFIDNIESWSTNEITINWNTPLAWVAAWLDEVGNPNAVRSTPAAVAAATDKPAHDKAAQGPKADKADKADDAKATKKAAKKK